MIATTTTTKNVHGPSTISTGQSLFFWHWNGRPKWIKANWAYAHESPLCNTFYRILLPCGSDILISKLDKWIKLWRLNIELNWPFFATTDASSSCHDYRVRISYRCTIVTGQFSYKKKTEKVKNGQLSKFAAYTIFNLGACCIVLKFDKKEIYHTFPDHIIQTRVWNRFYYILENNLSLWIK